MKRDLAIVTMTYNEKRKLPRWVRHYRRQVLSPKDIYILDHGSSDGSTDNLEDVNVVKVDRVENFTQVWRASCVSDFCSDLLSAYEHVIYTDADELVLANPNKFVSLLKYVTGAGDKANAVIGFDVIHDLDNEAALNEQPISEQRSKMQFVAAACKPLLISKKVRWSQGFHTSTHRPRFGDLYLFHLRYVDLSEGVERLEITRNLTRPDMKNVKADHQKISDSVFESWTRAWLKFPVNGDGPIVDNPTIESYLKSFDFRLDQQNMYDFDYSFRSPELFVFPEQWKGLV